MSISSVAKELNVHLSGNGQFIRPCKGQLFGAGRPDGPTARGGKWGSFKIANNLRLWVNTELVFVSKLQNVV